MDSQRIGRRGGAAFAFAAATSVLLVFAASAVAAGRPSTSSTSRAGLPAAGPGVQLAQNVAKPATYSDDQADAGRKSYEDRCVLCHGANLNDGEFGGPPLIGASFDQKFGNGAPASALFLFMSTLMPPDNPGQLTASTYADIMAYILKRNRYGAGAALPSNVEALDNLIIEK